LARGAGFADGVGRRAVDEPPPVKEFAVASLRWKLEFLLNF
jgi:hypothetical protein